MRMVNQARARTNLAEAGRDHRSCGKGTHDGRAEIMAEKTAHEAVHEAGVRVTHLPELGRFEASADGVPDAVGELAYTTDGRKMTILHTGVPLELEGHGIGSRLARAALEYARAHGLRVVPVCPFVRAYLKQHPEYLDVVDAIG
jgi:predicted GNAT family acetyltransferase